MKNSKITLATMIFILATCATFVGCEKERMDNSSIPEATDVKLEESSFSPINQAQGERIGIDTTGILNQEDIIGKKTAGAIKEVRTTLDLNAYQSKLAEISEFLDNELDEDYIANQNDAEMLLPLIENLTESSFEEYISISTSLEENILNSQGFSGSRKVYLLKRISRFEWLKYGLEVEVQGNPDPGESTYDDYLDYCMENFINENFVWATWVMRVAFVAGSPEILLYGVASCTETYLTN